MNKEKSNLIKTLIIVFAGSMMVAHGARMMSQGLFFPSSYYPAPLPNSFDFWFDWFTLSFVGGIVFIWGLVEFYRIKKFKKQEEKLSVIVPT